MRAIGNYYLDESGSTGDLINAGGTLDFAKQPIFALACVGVDDLTALAFELDRLKVVHRIQSPEIKSKSLRNKPHFARDLISYLNGRNLPIMIEIVEKRFFICATMVNHLICPALYPVDLEPGPILLRRIFAEYLCDHMPGGIVQKYIEACDGKSSAAVGETYDLLLSWLSACHDDDEIARGIRRFAADSQIEFLELSDQNAGGWNGLPIPDESKSGSPFWILPNLSSFTNIYARLNLAFHGEIGKLKLFHDEQLQFDELIKNGKLAAEKLASTNSVPQLPGANYSFSQSAQLEFISSENNAGIQAADVLAGFAMRYVQEALDASSTMAEPFRKVFRMLMQFDEANATGCNLVLSQGSMEMLQQPPTSE